MFSFCFIANIITNYLEFANVRQRLQQLKLQQVKVTSYDYSYVLQLPSTGTFFRLTQLQVK